MRKSLSIDSDGQELVVTWRAVRDSWRYILDAFKNEFSSYAEFDTESKTWRLPRNQHRALRAWASRYFEQHEIVDRTVQEQQQRPHQAPATALERAYRALYLVPGAPGWAITAMARAATKAHHPDTGGTHADMVRINAAIETLRREVAS